MRIKAFVVLLLLLLWLGIFFRTDAVVHFVVCIVCYFSSLPFSVRCFAIVCFLFFFEQQKLHGLND